VKKLVFVHGFLCGSALWTDQKRAFGDRFEVLTPDLPGYGENNEQLAPDSIGDFAAYVLDWLDERGVSSFDLIGHSMGGMIVQEMAARAPDRIERLVLYGTGPLGILPGRFETMEESRRRAAADGPEATARRIVATWFLRGEDAEGYESSAETGARASLQAVNAGLTAMETWDGRAMLERFSMPTLIVWGDRDRSYMWSQIEALWRGINNAQLAVLPGCAHNAHLEKPAIFNAFLEDFLVTQRNN